MERVKNIKELIIPNTSVLFEITIVEKTKSGIIIPDTAKEKQPMTGFIVSVGKDVTDLAEGDVILDSPLALEKKLNL